MSFSYSIIYFNKNATFTTPLECSKIPTTVAHVFFKVFIFILSFSHLSLKKINFSSSLSLSLSQLFSLSLSHSQLFSVMGHRRGCGAWVASVGVERGSPDLTNRVLDTPSQTRRRSLVWVWSVGHRISWIVSQTLRLGLEDIYWFGCGVWVAGSRRSCPRRSVSDSKTFTGLLWAATTPFLS